MYPTFLRNFFPLGVFLAAHTLAQAQNGTAPDLMSFANGTLPVSITTGSANLRVEMEHAIAIIDGNPRGFVAMRKPAAATDTIEITYKLAAPTRFTRFAVPNIFETPSPSQSFFKTIEITGAATPDGPFRPLAQATLTLHTAKGQTTELTLLPDQPEIQWVKLRLRDGLNIEKDKTFFEFSELIGNGTQQDPALSPHFNGVWSGRGVKIELAQDGATVTGCYDRGSKLNGTVQGNVLRALGTDPAGVPSHFILIADAQGTITGLRSSNGAPFRPYNGTPSTKAPICLPAEPPKLGCGSTIHGIGFDFNSAAIRPASQTILKSLHDGLSGNTNTAIQIIGHSSAEGAADYNRDLSHRRAQSVVAALVALGIPPNQISASGKGEDNPIASNTDEAGRSLNRRVEVNCLG